MINITVSHRTLKLLAISLAIVVLTLGSLSFIPERSSYAAGEMRANPKGLERIQSPFKFEPLKLSMKLEVTKVWSMGIDQIGDGKFAWAHVTVDNESKGQTLEAVYIPGERMQELFQLAYATKSGMTITAMPMTVPEGVEVEAGLNLYEVTSASVHPPDPGNLIFDLQAVGGF